jgi:hypothetical protein
LLVIFFDQFAGEIRDARCFREASAIGFAKALSADARIANDVVFTFNADYLDRQIISIRALGDESGRRERQLVGAEGVGRILFRNLPGEIGAEQSDD